MVKFIIYGTEIIPTESIRYLRVTYDQQSIFGEHIKQMISRADGRLAIFTNDAKY